jgi:GcrA cell cycle regulator
MAHVEWTQRMIDRFVVLSLNPDLSYTDMAKMLCREFKVTLTRNSCIGKAGRLGFPPRRYPPHRGGSMKGIPKPRHKKIVPPHAPAAPVLARKTIHRRRYVPSGGLPLLKLNEQDCRWAVGADRQGSHLFCARTKVDGSPYCEEHTRIAFVRPQRRA